MKSDDLEGASASEDPILVLCSKLDALMDLIQSLRPDLMGASRSRCPECGTNWGTMIGVNCDSCREHFKEWRKTIRLIPPAAEGPLKAEQK